VAELGKLQARGEWAALLSAARRLERASLAAGVQAQVTAWETEAGNRLAELNLEEGAGALRLAICSRPRTPGAGCRQAQLPELRERAAQLLTELAGGNPAAKGTAAPVAAAAAAPAVPEMAAAEEEAELDAAGRLSCCWRRSLTSWRSATPPPGSLSAGLAGAQEGDDGRALELFAKVRLPSRARCSVPSAVWYWPASARRRRGRPAAALPNCFTPSMPW